MKNKERLIEFGLRIKRERLFRRLSQEELAEKVDLSRNMISLIETGKSTPTILKVIAIADALEVDIDKLLKDL